MTLFRIRRIIAAITLTLSPLALQAQQLEEVIVTAQRRTQNLQDVPIVGNLFGTNEVAGNRTELLVVITPRVVRSDIDIREVSEDLRDRMKGLQRIDVLEKGKPQPAVSAPLQPLPPN